MAHYCSTCGSAVEDSANYCPVCGAALAVVGNGSGTVTNYNAGTNTYDNTVNNASAEGSTGTDNAGGISGSDVLKGAAVVGGVAVGAAALSGLARSLTHRRRPPYMGPRHGGPMGPGPGGPGGPGGRW